jgi:hypothetical protein
MSSLKKNSYKKKCKCDICKKFKNLNIGGVATALLQLDYFGDIPTIILGKERAGQYKGQYNIFAGKMEKEDNGCYVKAALREFTQESGIELSFNNFSRTITNRYGLYRYILHGKTVIFVSKISGISRDTLNNYIYKKNANLNLPWAFREIEKVERFTLDGKHIYKDKKTNKIIYNKKYCKISSFATGVMPKIIQFI